MLPKVLKLLISWCEELRTSPVERRRGLPLLAVPHQKVFCSLLLGERKEAHGRETSRRVWPTRVGKILAKARGRRE